MLDARMRPLIDPPLSRLAAAAVRAGCSADGVTLAGFAVGLLAIPAIAFEAYGLGLVLILLNRLADGLDGAIARLTEATDRGGFLDIALDFIFYSSIPFAFALADPTANAVASAFLIFSFIGTGCSFLAYAIMADRRGLSTDIRGQKSLYYLGGLTEGTETIGLFVLACLLPTWFPTLAWIFGALCWITTATRIHAGWQAFD
ncbi:MAG: CDP-alcohol phosphatidyltransferase family protein [Alphaproteobacteria bacterium]|nr:CDP-alcohol phosphatidyltransferase family protein [Alphaproteobacteria bacterium]